MLFNFAPFHKDGYKMFKISAFLSLFQFVFILLIELVRKNMPNWNEQEKNVSFWFICCTMRENMAFCLYCTSHVCWNVLNQRVPNLIGGKFVESKSLTFIDVINPVSVFFLNIELILEFLIFHFEKCMFIMLILFDIIGNARRCFTSSFNYKWRV